MSAPIPPPDEFGLPAPPWVFLVLLHLTFVAHLLMMNYVLGGSLVVAATCVLGKSRQGFGAVLVGKMLQVMPVAISLAITFGVGPLLFVQVLYGQFFYTANVLLGPVWLGLVVLLMLGFYGSYVVKRRHDRTGRGPGTSLLAVIVAVIFVLIAAIMTANAVLSLLPQGWLAIYHHQASRLVDHAMLLPRFLHNLIGALAITGLWIALLGRWADLPDSATGQQMTRLGLVLAAAATLVQAGVGLWFLLSLDAPARGVLLTIQQTSGWIWILAIAAAAVAVVIMLSGLNRLGSAGVVYIPAALLSLSLLGMSIARQAVRAAYLRPYPQFGPEHVRPQPSAAIVFVLTLLVGLAVIALMIRWIWPALAAQPGPARTAEPSRPTE